MDCQHGDWKTAKARIALIGDSTLDNVIWVKGPRARSISQQIAAAIPTSAVRNLAADGYTSSDTLNGCHRVISVGMRDRMGDPVPFDDDGLFRPLKVLQELEPAPTHIVLSVGGNDVREILSDMGQMPAVIAAFMANYPQIVEACLKVTPNVILMLQYRPSWFMDGGGYGVYQAIGSMPGPGDAVSKLNKLMETLYSPVLALARERGLAVLDLPRSFDIYNDELYEHQIEPSEAGGALISSLVSHVVAHHAAGAGSQLYLSNEGAISAEENLCGVGGAQWSIPHDPSAVPAGGDPSQLSEHDQKVMAIVGMGFDRPMAEHALEHCSGELQSAVNALLAEQK